MENKLSKIENSILLQQRLSEADAVTLFHAQDLHWLGRLANLACTRLNGNKASYIINRSINYTNYCILRCAMCAFSRSPGANDGFDLEIDEIVKKASEALSFGITELHIVGGLHPTRSFSYYVEMIKALRQISKKLTLKCFTAIEILHFSKIAGLSVETVLETLKQAGLDCLTGGGAEIFCPDIRSKIAEKKGSAIEYLKVHKTWHQMGGKSTCTMLFGHIESIKDRVNHLALLRQLQDETNGFVGFVPLPWKPSNLRIKRYAPTGLDKLKTIAVSRLFLDNFKHITAYWPAFGRETAQVALDYGADDLHGTLIEEKIFHMTNDQSPQQISKTELISAIKETGKIPIQRDSFYNPIEESTN